MTPQLIQRRKTAIVIVGMQEKIFRLGKPDAEDRAEGITDELYRRCRVAKYSFGDLDDGILRVCELLQFARVHHMPVILGNFAGAGNILPQVRECAPEAKLVELSWHPSLFEYVDFRNELSRLGIMDLVIGGYPLSGSIRQTIDYALDIAEMLIGRTIEVLAPANAMFEERGTIDSEIETSWNFLRGRTRFFETVELLLRELEHAQA